jgi:hypothetical protein
MTRPLRLASEQFLLLAAMALLAFLLVACGPEANRVDGDGKESGADVGNWGDTVQLHGDDDRNDSMYYKTPDELPTE